MDLEQPITTKQVRILIVDDNEINRILLKKMLSKYPFQLGFCEDGQQAFDKLMDREFDIVLMDIHMPIMDGLETTKMLRELPDPYFQQLPIIALTASTLANDVEKIYRIGFNDYQSKPFKIEELIEKIARLIPSEQ